MLTNGDMQKTISVRMDEEQAEKLQALSERLHNSDAGVLRFALDLLWQTVVAKGVVPADMAVEGKTEEATA